jgi:hypothetical protein
MVALLRSDATDIPSFRWDNKINRYRYNDTGRLLSPVAANAITQRRTDAATAEIRGLGESLIGGKISLEDWQRQTAVALKSLSIGQLELSRGGKRYTYGNDYLAVGRALKDQYRYLRQFAIDLNRGYSVRKDGTQQEMTEARFKARLDMYAEKAAKLSTEIGKQANAFKDSKAYMQRHLGATDRHCAECLLYASQGIRPIGTLPLPTEACTCRSRCKCYVEYFDSSEFAKMALS